MEPSYPRNESNTRGRRSYYGRRYQSSQNWSQHDAGPSVENDSTPDGHPRGSDEMQRNGATHQERTVHSDNLRQSGPRGRQYYKQQVPSKEHYRNREDFRRDDRRKGKHEFLADRLGSFLIEAVYK